MSTPMVATEEPTRIAASTKVKASTRGLMCSVFQETNTKEEMNKVIPTRQILSSVEQRNDFGIKIRGDLARTNPK